MNVYDQAHNLEQAIRESEEYKRMKAAQEKVEEDPNLKSMIDDFHQKQIAVQTKQMLGEEVAQDVIQSVSNLSAIVMQNPVAAEYLQCEMRFGLMMQDVYKILGDLVMPGK